MNQVPEQILLQAVEKTMVKQAVPLQPMEDHGDEDTHTAIHREPMLQQDPGRTCGSKVGPTLEQPVPEGLCPLERTHAKAVLRNCFFPKVFPCCFPNIQRKQNNEHYIHKSLCTAASEL